MASGMYMENISILELRNMLLTLFVHTFDKRLRLSAFSRTSLELHNRPSA